MLADEIKAGESVNIEFKVEVPKRSEKYIKSVIAFANTAGGKIIIGVDDESHEIVGVDKDEVFKIMDSITNAISDMCYPQIFPNIGVDTVEGKCVIVIEIYPGANRPYYMKSLGKEAGTLYGYQGHPELLMWQSLKIWSCRALIILLMRWSVLRRNSILSRQKNYVLLQKNI